MAALEALIAGLKVRCEVVERGRHGRQGLLAQWVGIGRRLVSGALEYRRYSKDYVAAEARNARRGLWRVTFVKPWEWRIVTAQVSTPSAPAETRQQGA